LRHFLKITIENNGVSICTVLELGAIFSGLDCKVWSYTVFEETSQAYVNDIIHVPAFKI